MKILVGIASAVVCASCATTYTIDSSALRNYGLIDNPLTPEEVSDFEWFLKMGDYSTIDEILNELPDGSRLLGGYGCATLNTPSGPQSGFCYWARIAHDQTLHVLADSEDNVFEATVE